LIWKAAQPGPKAPGFVLRDAQGRLTSLAQFHGKVVALTFLDPECQQICPLTTETMRRAVAALGPAAAGRVQMLGVNVNAADSRPAALDAYTRAHGLSAANWRFLTGTPQQLQRVWRDYNIHVALVAGDIQHEAEVILIDPEGRERTIEPTLMSYGAVGDEASRLARDMNQLLPGLAPNLRAVAGDPPPTPLEKLQFADAAGGVPVRYAAGDAHLTVFFGTWLGSPSELATPHAPLAAYAQSARAKHWPAPVAADVLTVEPDPAAAQQALPALAKAAGIPVIADATGELADDLQVQDMPWYVLTSGTGRVLWSHDGWLSADELAREVRQATAAATVPRA
jgi:cytochrome oxidase Cu insertion factor (SCO1/SenC/PrrC family)